MLKAQPRNWLRKTSSFQKQILKLDAQLYTKVVLFPWLHEQMTKRIFNHSCGICNWSVPKVRPTPETFLKTHTSAPAFATQSHSSKQGMVMCGFRNVLIWMIYLDMKKPFYAAKQQKNNYFSWEIIELPLCLTQNVVSKPKLYLLSACFWRNLSVTSKLGTL